MFARAGGFRKGGGARGTLAAAAGFCALTTLPLLALAGCAPAPKCAASPTAPKSAAPAETRKVEPKPDATPRLTLTLVPKASSATIAVRVDASGPGSELVHFSLARAAAGSVTSVAAADPAGPIPVSVSPAGDGLAFTLARAPRSPVTLSYERAATPFAPGPLGVSLDPNRMVAVGDALVALPVSFAERVVPVTVKIDAEKIPPNARGASSLGVGEERMLELSGNAVRRVAFLAGPMGQAVMDGPEGHDETAWLGYTRFDPRSVAAEVASFRSAAREYFGEKNLTPFTLMLISDGRPAGGFDVARQTASAVVNVGVNQTYAGPVRIAVAHQLLREWLGPVLWLGPDGDRRNESVWFVEGVARYLARELSFRFGLLTPAEYLAEIDEVERLVVTSPDATLGNADLAKKAKDPRVAALLIARGARHASAVDARIRAKSKGQRSLDTVLRALYAEARKAKGPLPESAWERALESELGADGPAQFREEILAGRGRELPADSFGPCFAPAPRRFESFALGFESDGDLQQLPVTITHIAPGGPAARAGLRDGDRVTRAVFEDGSPGVPVRLDVERAGEQRHVEYRPVGALVSSRGFNRLTKVPDDRCTVGR